jgi:hypothetical protein
MLNARIEQSLQERLASLEEHLRLENPVLVEAVQLYRELDQVAYRMGLLPRDESFALRIAWWPLIAVLGTFSAGKSTFINDYLGQRLQVTGNQAVDDKFTVICFGREERPRVLPGTALNADPRFPFFQFSREVEKVAAGEGRRIDSYLQLKTCPRPRAQGKMLIDSPGYDADAQRSSTLRITDHIIDLSDLVLILFDARHPEPGAMQDTLERLVAGTVGRPDATKFLYILNQIDTAAREDNPEEVIAAWQRALAQKGLTSGRFYTIYSREVAVPIESEAVRERFQAKRDSDLDEIYARMHEVEVERAYRIVGRVERTARELEESIVPQLATHLGDWRRRVRWLDVGLLGAVVVVLAGWVLLTDAGVGALPRWADAHPQWAIAAAAVALLVLLLGHYRVRALAARRVERRIPAREGPGDPDLRAAFRHSTRPLAGLRRKRPAGWGSGAQRRLRAVGTEVTRHIQRLNDAYADPSAARRAETAAVEAERRDRALGH